MASCDGFPTKNDMLIAKQSIDHISHVAKSRDNFNNPADSVTDPIGDGNFTNLTLDGLEKLYYEAIAAAGYITLDSFQAGAPGGALTLPNQVLRDTTTGEYYRWDGIFPKSVPAGSTPASTGGIGLGTWVGVGDASLRANLASHASGMGGNLVSLEGSGNVQTAILHLTPQMFGAKADYIIGTPGTPGTGTDDTAAIQACVDYAVAHGYREIHAHGHYLHTAPINMKGTGGTVVAAIPGAVGVRIIGSGKDNTTFYFRSSSDDQAAFNNLGGSGYHTPRSLNSLTLHPTSDRLYKAFGYRLQGACMSINYDVAIMKFAVGVHLYNSSVPGVFTEYNEFNSCRLHRNIVNVLFEVSGGDNSFHANSFDGGQFQIKTNQDLGDGNTTPGIGIELRGSTTTPAYWYDAKINTSFFGGPGAKAFKITRTNTDNLIGNITAEGSLICEQADSSSTFELKGGLYSIAPVTFSITSEPTTGKASAFIFANLLSNTLPFTSPRLAGLSPTQVPLFLADTTDSGGRTGLFRAIGSGIDSPYFTCAGTTGNGFYFGYTPGSSPLQGFVPGIKISHDGGSFSSYSSSFVITNAITGFRLTATSLEPQTDNNISSGSNSFRYTTIYSVNSVISTSDATHKSDPLYMSVAEENAFYEIGELPSVWMWLKTHKPKDDDDDLLHSGPTVQAAISVMKKYGLNWKKYAAFHYYKGEDDEIYSFRKEELLLWITYSMIKKQKELERRMIILENK